MSTTLGKRVRALFDAKKHASALPLTEQWVAAEPSNLDALHAWNVASQAAGAPFRNEIQIRILELTRGTAAGEEPTLERRARALALYLQCGELVRSQPTETSIHEAQRLFDEAMKLRKIDVFAPLQITIEAWSSALKSDFDALVTRVRKRPGSKQDASRMYAHPDFVGLGPVFEYPPFFSYLAQLPAGKASPAFDDALLVAAGLERFARINPFAKDDEFEGRPGRLLTLLHLGASSNATDDDGTTALHCVAAVGDARSIETLLRAGALLNAKSKNGTTPLHAASENDRVPAAAKLVEMGADVNARGEHLRTPAHEANSAEMVQLLAAAGADFGLADSSDLTPLDRAAQGNDPKLVAALKGVSSKSSKLIERAQTEAISRGNTAIAKVLGAKPKTSAIDVAPLLKLLAAKPKLLPFFSKKDFSELEQILESAALAGAANWDWLAKTATRHPAWHALALVILAKHSLPQAKPTTRVGQLPKFVVGDLAVQGDLHLDGALLVSGDLTVSGVITDSRHDSLLAVGGVLHAKAIFTDGEIGVAGDLNADDFVYGYYNDHVLTVLGTLSSPVVIEDDHSVVAKKIRSKNHFGIDAFKSDAPELRKKFVAQSFSADGLDPEKMAGLSKRGRSVLR